MEEAIALAARAGQWDVVRLLGAQLDAQRLTASGNVIDARKAFTKRD